MLPTMDDEARIGSRTRVGSELQALKDDERNITQANYEALGQTALFGGIVIVTACLSDLKWTVVSAVLVLVFILCYQASLLAALGIRTRRMQNVIHNEWSMSPRRR